VEGLRSFGWFYDVMKLSLPISSFGGDKWIDYFYALDTYDIYAMKCNPANDGLAGNCGPGMLFESYDYRSTRASRTRASPTTSADRRTTRSTRSIRTRRTSSRWSRSRADVYHLSRRPLRPQTAALRDRGRRVLLPSSPTNPGGIEVYFIANPGFGVTQVLLPDYPDYTTPKPRAITTASSSVCASGSLRTGP